MHVERQRLRALDETVEQVRRAQPWKPENGLAMLALVTEGVVRTAREGPQVLRAVWDHCRQRVARGVNPDAEWQAFNALFDDAVQAMRKALALAEDFGPLGFPLEGLPDLEDAVQEVAKMRREAFREWSFSREVAEQALAEHAQGKSLDIDEAFAGIAGSRAEDWRRRAEALRQFSG